MGNRDIINNRGWYEIIWDSCSTDIPSASLPSGNILRDRLWCRKAQDSRDFSEQPVDRSAAQKGLFLSLRALSLRTS